MAALLKAGKPSRFPAWSSLTLVLLYAVGYGRGETARPLLDISADTPAFETLRRIQTRSDSLYPSQAYPQVERGMEGFLEHGTLTGFDSASLRAHLPDFRRPLVEWSDSVRGHSLFISPILETGWRIASGDDPDGDARLVGMGGRLYGALFPRLSFYSHATVYTEFTDKAQFSHQFSPESGETYSVEKGAGDSLLKDRTYNRFECYLLADLPWVTLKAGRDRVHLGPGYFSSLMATQDTPPYYMLEARFDFASWLSLDDYLLRMTDTRHDIDKYANLHRFEFRPMRSLSLAFQDIVIYQDRNPDLRYALPLVPITFTESDMGGPDNSAMGFDFLYGGIRNLTVWGELFIDDLLGPASFFDDFWENRWAALAGFQVTSPVPWLDADLVMEYGRVEPWTYNGRQAQTSFKHFNVPSASRLGPDSRTWDTQISYRPVKWLELRERFAWYDKGLGRSGTLGAIHEDSLDGLTKELLSGPVRSTRSLETSARFLYGQFLSGSLAWSTDLADGPESRLVSELRFAW
ncbi:MAG: hypothetical protein JWP91_1694 [Fibrobacteres bacterium]|nr:hypothetical protein [Fibrobacterota bacterium]